MNVTLKRVVIMIVVLWFGMALFAGQSVTFFTNGRNYTGTIIDMSSNTGVIDYQGNAKSNRNEVWMINYESGDWDYPDERDQLANGTDTVFLRNGQILTGKLTDFSSRRFVWEFQNGGEVHESAVKRIYFCCVKLPQAFKQSQNESNQNSDSYAAVFLLDGNYVETPLKYLNNRKTGFTDGLQINTKDIWMINLENDNWDFADERQELDSQTDSIFLKNGEVFYDRLVSFDEQRRVFEFEDSKSIRESKISRIYFCCNKLPDAYRSSGNRHGSKRSMRNR